MMADTMKKKHQEVENHFGDAFCIVHKMTYFT